MKKYTSTEIRNVGFVSHSGAGKTMLADAFLYNAKATTRLNRPDDENSTFDFEPEAINRRSSIAVGVGYAEWKKHKINILDTPGDFNFGNETILATRAMDAAVCLVSAVDGVEVGTEKVWAVISEQTMPRAIVINKIDRERASFTETLADIRENMASAVTPVQLPIGGEEDFKGVIDLVANKALIFKDDGSYTSEEIPADMADEVEEARENLIEGVAESDEDLLEKFFDEGTLGDEDLKAGLAKGFKAGVFVPVFCTSASKNIGVSRLMDGIIDMFPNPLERADIPAMDMNGEDEGSFSCGGDTMAGFVFRTLVDPYAGKMTVLRIYSGSMSPDANFYNVSIDTTERYGPLQALQGKKLDPMLGAAAGDIVTLVKLKDTRLGHTITAKKSNFVVKHPEMMPPIIGLVINPKTQADEEKIGPALQKVMDEDITLALSRDESSKAFLLSGLGQLHIELAIERMKRKFGVEATLSIPNVPYKETIKRKAVNIEGKHKKQSGGRGQFGVCYIDIEPNERGGGFEFIDNIVGGSIPRNFIPSVEKGIRMASKRGALAGFEMVDFKVRLFDGKFHPVDSSDAAFQVAGSKGFKLAAAAAQPIILEPVMEMAITVPKEALGDVMGDVNSRRGRIAGVDEKGKNNIVRAQIPMADVLRYAPDLKSMTSGRGSFTMQFSHYDEVPASARDKIIADAGGPAQDDDE